MAWTYLWAPLLYMCAELSRWKPEGCADLPALGPEGCANSLFVKPNIGNIFFAAQTTAMIAFCSSISSMYASVDMFDPQQWQQAFASCQRAYVSRTYGMNVIHFMLAWYSLLHYLPVYLLVTFFNQLYVGSWIAFRFADFCIHLYRLFEIISPFYQ